MAPRRGGSSSSSSPSGGSSGSSSCGSGFPCSTDFRFLYGHRGTSVFSEGEMYGQLVVYAIWAAILIALLIRSWAFKPRLLQGAIASLVIAFAFLCARYGLLVADASIPIGYRFEASIVDLFYKLGIVLLFATVIHYTKASRLIRLACWALFGVLAVMAFVYVVMSFIVSNDAMGYFETEWWWHFSDRDFGLTYSPEQIERLKINGSVGLAFSYLIANIYGIDANYLDHRDAQIKVGLAANVLALVLAISLVVSASLAWMKERSLRISSTTLALFATFGLVFTTLFQLIITAAFVVPNWAVVTDLSRWVAWELANPDIETGDVLEGFLSGYVRTVNGFPVAQAVLEPLGIVLACVVMLYFVIQSQDTNEGKVQAGSGEKLESPEHPTPQEYYPTELGGQKPHHPELGDQKVYPAELPPQSYYPAVAPPSPYPAELAHQRQDPAELAPQGYRPAELRA